MWSCGLNNKFDKNIVEGSWSPFTISSQDTKTNEHRARHVWCLAASCKDTEDASHQFATTTSAALSHTAQQRNCDGYNTFRFTSQNHMNASLNLPQTEGSCMHTPTINKMKYLPIRILVILLVWVSFSSCIGYYDVICTPTEQLNRLRFTTFCTYRCGMHWPYWKHHECIWMMSLRIFEWN